MNSYERDLLPPMCDDEALASESPDISAGTALIALIFAIVFILVGCVLGFVVGMSQRG